MLFKLINNKISSKTKFYVKAKLTGLVNVPFLEVIVITDFC